MQKQLDELRADITKLTLALMRGGVTPQQITLGRSIPSSVLQQLQPDQRANFMEFFRGLYGDEQRKALAAALTRFFFAWADYQAAKQTFLMAYTLRASEVDFVESNKVEWTLARVLDQYFQLGPDHVFRQYARNGEHYLLVNRTEHEMAYGASFEEDDERPMASAEDE
jgi:hypothetical protein